ncbi:MAG: hypothetical protein WBM39_07865 [Parasphingorhabdus sp.]
MNDVLISQRIAQCIRQARQLGIKIFSYPLFQSIARSDHTVFAADPDQTINVDLVMFDDYLAFAATIQRNGNESLATIHRLEPECTICFGVNRIRIKSGSVGIVQFAQQRPFPIQFVKILDLTAIEFRCSQLRSHPLDPYIANTVSNIFNGLFCGAFDIFCPAIHCVDSFCGQTILDICNPRADFFFSEVIARHHDRVIFTRQPVNNITAAEAVSECVLPLFFGQQLRLATIHINRENIREAI